MYKKNRMYVKADAKGQNAWTKSSLEVIQNERSPLQKPSLFIYKKSNYVYTTENLVRESQISEFQVESETINRTINIKKWNFARTDKRRFSFFRKMHEKL